jgi:hypothetical protein
LKVTIMAAGSTCRSPKPAGACQELLAAIILQTSLRLLGARYAPRIGVPPGRLSFTALRDTVTASMRLGHGSTAALLAGALHRLHADITRHPARWTVPHRPGRHFPRYTIRKVRSRTPGDIVADATRTRTRHASRRRRRTPRPSLPGHRNGTATTRLTSHSTIPRQPDRRQAPPLRPQPCPHPGKQPITGRAGSRPAPR